MLFSFQCQKCMKKFDGEFSIGKAPRTTACPTCKGNSKRIYEGMSIAVKIGGSFAKSTTFGEQMKSRNMKAKYKQQGKTPGLRLAGYQYEDGRVEEVKSK